MKIGFGYQVDYDIHFDECTHLLTKDNNIEVIDENTTAMMHTFGKHLDCSTDPVTDASTTTCTTTSEETCNDCVEKLSPSLEDARGILPTGKGMTSNKLSLDLTTSTPSISSANDDTLSIEYRARKLKLNETNLKLKLKQAASLPCNNEVTEELDLSTFPEAVFRVDQSIVKEIKFVEDWDNELDVENQIL